VYWARAIPAPQNRPTSRIAKAFLPIFDDFIVGEEIVQLGTAVFSCHSPGMNKKINIFPSHAEFAVSRQVCNWISKNILLFVDAFAA
jgi:hypothetical protein